MTTAIIALGVAVSWLGLAVALLITSHAKERVAWVAERQKLVDRAIARHTGEVLALDRTAHKSPQRSSLDNVVERPTPVGL